MLASLRGEPDGFVKLRCRALPDQRVDDCKIVSETPSWLGFGGAALAAAKGGRLTPEFASKGQGRRFTFDVKFRMSRTGA